jgi:hypothetical protein
MGPETGDEFIIRIGGDAYGPVIAGHNNRVKNVVENAGTTEGDENPPTNSSQTNTASDDGTVYAVTNGDMHIYHADGPERDG